MLAVYKCFIRSHLEYRYVVYDQPDLSCLISKNELAHSNVALAVSGAIKKGSKEKFYQELGIESLKERRWLRQFSYLWKIVSKKQPAYLYDLILPFQTWSRNKGFLCEPSFVTVSFNSLFVQYATKERNKLDSQIRNAEAYGSFWKILLIFIRPTGNST